MDRPERYLGVNHRLERHVDNDAYREFVRNRWGGMWDRINLLASTNYAISL